eukprot:7967527-Prorocentrum_lima.AAC.1
MTPTWKPSGWLSSWQSLRASAPGAQTQIPRPSIRNWMRRFRTPLLSTRLPALRRHAWMPFAQPEASLSSDAISYKLRLLLSSSRHKPRPQRPRSWTRNSSTLLQTRQACCSSSRRTSHGGALKNDSLHLPLQ